MGFADYLSRHPSGPPVPTNEDDEKFVVNIKQEMKHAIRKQKISPLGLNKPTGNLNQSESNIQNERNDVTHSQPSTHTKESAFCHSKLKKKSHYSLPTVLKQSNHNL